MPTPKVSAQCPQILSFVLCLVLRYSYCALVCMSQKIIDRTHVGDVLQRLYGSDLDITISLISKGGYFYLGTEDKRISLQGTTVEEAVTHLANKIAHEFPSSNFGRWWANNFPQDYGMIN